MSHEAIEVRPCGEHAALLEVGADAVLATYHAVLAVLADQSRWAARDVVPAATTVLLDGVCGGPLRELVDAVARCRVTSTVRDAQGPVEVPTTYDGDDLDEVARLWDMTVSEVVATHVGTHFEVAFCGFSPGFAYCTGLPPSLHVPRRRTPRARVPAGSVALAGEFTGVYPTPSPGGWQLLGRTEVVLWDAAAEPPATLSPGTPVRFVEVGRP